MVLKCVMKKTMNNLTRKFAIELTLIIAVVFPILIHYGVSSFSPRPRGHLPQEGAYDSYRDFYILNLQTDATKAQKDAARQRLQTLRKNTKRYASALFYIAVPLGLSAIILSLFIKIPVIGYGLIIGGVLALVDGYYAYWTYLNDSIKFASLLCVLVVLIVVCKRKTTNHIHQ